MKDRLEKFMKTEGLSSSRFAEIMGVQPSNISHLLNGRNNPSLDFIHKMLLRFPKINPDWLILGKGSIYRPLEGDVSFSASTQSQTTAPNNSLFDDAPLRVNTDVNTNEKNAMDVVERNTTAVASPTAQPAQESYASKKSVNSSVHALAEPFGDEIERIVIFLKDKTFISYHHK